MASAWGNSWSTFWSNAWGVITGGDDALITDDRDINVYRNIAQDFVVQRKVSLTCGVHSSVSQTSKVFKGSV